MNEWMSLCSPPLIETYHSMFPNHTALLVLIYLCFVRLLKAVSYSYYQLTHCIVIVLQYLIYTCSSCSITFIQIPARNDVYKWMFFHAYIRLPFVIRIVFLHRVIISNRQSSHYRGSSYLSVSDVAHHAVTYHQCCVYYLNSKHYQNSCALFKLFYI